MGPDKDKQYCCGIPSCDFKAGRFKLDEHLRKQHRDVSDYFCKTCWARFARLSAYVDHVKYDVCKVRTGTAICGALGCTHKSDLKDLKQHVQTQHHDLNKFICKTCFVGFDHHLKFLSHAASMVCWEKVLAEAAHNAQRQQSGLSLLCPVANCPYVARKSQDLIDHGDGTHPDCKEYACKRCNAAFADMTAAICHYLETECCRAAHEDGSASSVPCGVPGCEQVVPNGSLVRHILVSHPGSSDFLCKRCDGSFAAVTSFVTHAKICDAEERRKSAGGEPRPPPGFQPRFRCFYCKAKFDEYEEFEFHHGEAHPKKEPTVQLWSVGAAKYTRRSTVDARVVESDPICSVCTVQMANKETLMKHVLVIHRRHCCPRCGATFSTAEELGGHRTDVHGKFERARAEKESEARKKEEGVVGWTRGVEEGLEEPRTRNRFECYLCSLVCRSKTGLQRHALSSHRVYVCFHCEYVASGATAPDDFRVHHVLRHSSEGTLRHPDVPDEAENKNSTRVPDRDPSGNSTRAKDVAEYSWRPSKTTTKIRASSDEWEESDVRCERCKKGFATRNDLHRHMARLHRLRFFCNFCNAGTTQKQQLSCHHVAKHAGEAFKYVTLQGDAFVEREEFPSPASIERLLRDDEGMLSSSEASSDLQSEESEWSPHYFSDDAERNSRRQTRSAKKSKSRLVAEEEGRERRRSKRVSERDATLRSIRSALADDEDTDEEEPLPKIEGFESNSPTDVTKAEDVRSERSEVPSGRSDDEEGAAYRKRKLESPAPPVRSRKNPKWEAVTVKREPETDDVRDVPVKREVTEWRRKEEGGGVAEEPERAPVLTAPRKVFGGFRVPKTSGAFRKLLQNIGDVYKCCDFACPFSTTSPQRFVLHLQRHEADRLFCIYCGANVADADGLLDHLDAEHGSSVNQCTKCLYRASTQRHIECHFAHAHPNESSSYVTISTTGGARSEAMALLESSKPYRCGFATCGFSTMKTSELFRHLRSGHPDELSYPCPLCGETKEDIEDLVSHFPDHGVNNVQCAYCSHCSVTIGGIILHLCYCHADRVIKFYFRSSELEEEFIKVLKSSEYIVPHYFVDLVREKTPVLSADLQHIEFQQRCPFCPAWCGGFKAFRSHVLSEHVPVVRSEELAESLFENYDFRMAVHEGRCPFCSYVAQTTKELQEHVLDQELAYAPYECHLCMQTFGTERELDDHLFDRHVDEQKLVFHNPDTQLLAWVRSNIVLGAPAVEEASGALDADDGILQVTSVFSTRGDAVEEGVVDGEHRCGKCDMTTFSETYYRNHLLTCKGRPPEAVLSTGAAKFTCTICSAGFEIMQTFARHGRDEHDLHYFCSVCFRGSRTKAALRDHLGIHHEGNAKAYVIDDPAKGQRRRTSDFRLVVCDVDAESEEGSSRAEEGFSFYGTDYVHVDTKNLTVVRDGVKVGVRSVMRSGNYEPYILLKDLKELWC